MHRRGRARTSDLPVVLGLGLAFVVAPLGGQTPGRAPAVLELPAGTRAMALGHAFVLGSRDPDVLFHNPAGLAGAAGVALAGHAVGGPSLALSLATATGWWDGGVGLGLQALHHEATGPQGGLEQGGLDRLRATGSRAVAELVASAGYGRSVGPLRVGAAGKLLERRVGGARTSRAALDVGAAFDVGPVVMGLAARNLSAEALAGDGAPESPTELTAGAGGYGQPVGPLDLGGAVAVTRRDDGEVVVGGGLEVGYWPVTGRTFVGRVGLRNVPEGRARPWTVGAAFQGDRLVLEWAWQPFPGGRGAHRFGLGFR